MAIFFFISITAYAAITVFLWVIAIMIRMPGMTQLRGNRLILKLLNLRPLIKIFRYYAMALGGGTLIVVMLALQNLSSDIAPLFFWGAGLLALSGVYLAGLIFLVSCPTIKEHIISDNARQTHTQLTPSKETRFPGFSEEEIAAATRRNNRVFFWFAVLGCPAFLAVIMIPEFHFLFGVQWSSAIMATIFFVGITDFSLLYMRKKDFFIKSSLDYLRRQSAKGKAHKS